MPRKHLRPPAARTDLQSLKIASRTGWGPDHHRNLAAVMIGAHVLGVFWLGPFLGATTWLAIMIVLILWFTIARAWPRKFR